MAKNRIKKTQQPITMEGLGGRIPSGGEQLITPQPITTPFPRRIDEGTLRPPVEPTLPGRRLGAGRGIGEKMRQRREGFTVRQPDNISPSGYTQPYWLWNEEAQQYGFRGGTGAGRREQGSGKFVGGPQANYEAPFISQRLARPFADRERLTKPTGVSTSIPEELRERIPPITLGQLQAEYDRLPYKREQLARLRGIIQPMPIEDPTFSLPPMNKGQLSIPTMLRILQTLFKRQGGEL